MSENRLLTPLLVAAALACWAIPAFGFLGGALGLRGCPDECHGYVIVPLASAVLLWPAAAGLAATAAWAWNRTGHAVAAPRALVAALVAAATATVVVAIAGAAAVSASGPRRGPTSPHLTVFALAALAALAVACAGLAGGLYRSELRSRR